MISHLYFGRSTVNRPTQPVQVTRVSPGVYTSKLDLEGKIFDDSFALAHYVAKRFPVDGIHDSFHREKYLEMLKSNPDQNTINQYLSNRKVYFKRVNSNVSANYISKHWVGDARVRGADDIARQVRDGEISPQKAREAIKHRMKQEPAFRMIRKACGMISQVEKLSYYPKKAEDRQKLVRNLTSQLCGGRPAEKVIKTCQGIIEVNTLIPEMKRAKISNALSKQMTKQVLGGGMNLQEAMKDCRKHQWQNAIKAARKPLDNDATTQVLVVLKQMAADHRHMLAVVTQLQGLIKSGQVDNLRVALEKIKELNARYYFND